MFLLAPAPPYIAAFEDVLEAKKDVTLSSRRSCTGTARIRREKKKERKKKEGKERKKKLRARALSN